MEKLLEQLKNTSSINDKVNILKSYENDDEVKTCLHLAYDPFTMFYIKKMSPTGVGNKTFRDTFQEFVVLAEKLNTRELTGNAAKDAVNSFLSQCSVSTQDTYMKILQKDFKVGVTETLINRAFGEGFIETFDVQLAKKYSEEYTKKSVKSIPYFWASAKFDGLRCYATKGKLLTRNGHDIVGFPDIMSELEMLKKDVGYKFCDGELYTTEFKFQRIQGAVMSNKNIDPVKKQAIRYHIFVIGKDSYKNTEEMVNVMRSVDWSKYKYLIPVEYFKVQNTMEDVKSICEKLMLQGYEGVMLRHPDVWYEWKRSIALMKFKLFREADFVVTGFYPGEKGTALEHTLGGIYIEGKVTVTEESSETVFVKSGTGSGFDIGDEDEMCRDYVWKHRDELLGKIVEIKFQNLTDDNTSLRFPVFIKWKFDRE